MPASAEWKTLSHTDGANDDLVTETVVLLMIASLIGVEWHHLCAGRLPRDRTLIGGTDVVVLFLFSHVVDG